MNEMGAKNRAAYIVSMVILSIAALMILGASYLAFVSVKVITPNVQPYKVITKEVKAGDDFIYEVDACKHQAKPSTVVRRFIDSDGTRYPQVIENSNITVGCSKIRVPVPTPGTLKAGIWYLDIEVSYQVNPLRTENYHFTTEKFKIIEE